MLEVAAVPWLFPGTPGPGGGRTDATLPGERRDSEREETNKHCQQWSEIEELIEPGCSLGSEAGNLTTNFYRRKLWVNPNEGGLLVILNQVLGSTNCFGELLTVKLRQGTRSDLI